MKVYKICAALAAIMPLTCFSDISGKSIEAANYADKTYNEQIVKDLASLVSYNTVARDGIPSDKDPEHIAFKNKLKEISNKLGFGYDDYGYLVKISFGEDTAPKSIGIIAHGDVQPADPSKWKQSPYKLDTTSEKGRLIGRGTQDDKASIVDALYAMKSIKDLNLKLDKRIELYVYMAEESEWGPLENFVKTHKLPSVNITVDSDYPVVTAEKGYGSIFVTFPPQSVSTDKPTITEFGGGFFDAQIPEDAFAVINHADDQLVQNLKAKAATQTDTKYDITRDGNQVTIKAKGKAVHSSTPQNGVNAITHLAALLNDREWPKNQAGNMVNFINNELGTGYYGEQFGNIAYQDDFMGKMTVSLTVIKDTPKGKEFVINLRSPMGKTAKQLDQEITNEVHRWEKEHSLKLTGLKTDIEPPFYNPDSPQIQTLLDTFAYFTGTKNPKPVAIGGSTNSKLFPNAVSFGPTMPGVAYTGHSEHEFITLDQFRLNLKMYTAVLTELAVHHS